MKIIKSLILVCVAWVAISGLVSPMIFDSLTRNQQIILMVADTVVVIVAFFLLWLLKKNDPDKKK